MGVDFDGWLSDERAYNSFYGHDEDEDARDRDDAADEWYQAEKDGRDA